MPFCKILIESSVAPILSSIIGIGPILATSRIISFDEIEADINLHSAV